MMDFTIDFVCDNFVMKLFIRDIISHGSIAHYTSQALDNVNIIKTNCKIYDTSDIINCKSNKSGILQW